MSLFEGIDIGYVMIVAGSVSAALLLVRVFFMTLRLVFRVVMGILLAALLAYLLASAVAEPSSLISIGLINGIL